MHRLVLISVLAVLASACDVNYDVWFDGRCFRQNYQTSVLYSAAFDVCERDHAYLPALKSKEDNDQVFDSLAHQFGYSFWLGLACDGEDFVWPDGAVANYTNFAADYKCSKSTIGRKYYYGNDKLWYESTNGQSTIENNVVCEAKARSASPCDGYDVAQSGGFDDTCYRLQQASKNWEDAEASCQIVGAHLSVIHNQALNDFIRRTAVSAEIKNGIHIGIKKDSSGNFSWVDGSTMDYTNFKIGFPTSASDCVYMDTTNTTGQWGSIGCTNTPLSYVCTKPAFYATNPQPAGCPKKTKYAPGDEIYSPSYPQAPGASICDYQLVEEDTMKRAQVEISFVEANSCCDMLTVYDGLQGTNVLATLTGFYPNPITIIAQSNAVRLHWNATSGAHVRGFHAKMKNSLSK